MAEVNWFAVVSKATENGATERGLQVFIDLEDLFTYTAPEKLWSPPLLDNIADNITRHRRGYESMLSAPKTQYFKESSTVSWSVPLRPDRPRGRSAGSGVGFGGCGEGDGLRQRKGGRADRLSALEKARRRH